MPIAAGIDCGVAFAGMWVGPRHVPVPSLALSVSRVSVWAFVFTFASALAPKFADFSLCMFVVAVLSVALEAITLW